MSDEEIQKRLEGHPLESELKRKFDHYLELRRQNLLEEKEVLPERRAKLAKFEADLRTDFDPSKLPQYTAEREKIEKDFKSRESEWHARRRAALAAHDELAESLGGAGPSF